jgi:hypothetical protein
LYVLWLQQRVKAAAEASKRLMQRLESLQKRLESPVTEALKSLQRLEKRTEQKLDNMMNQRSKKVAKARDGK